MKQIIKIFQDNGLKITIEANLLQVNFLDVTLNLPNSKYWPFHKENSTPLYIHRGSNHPPCITKQLPLMIQRRISSLSCNQNEFDKNKAAYNKALAESGFEEKIEYSPSPDSSHKRKRSRKRKIIWFNPPYNSAVKTDIGRKFLNLISTHFPRSHKFSKIFNKNTIKLSYSCTQNMSSLIASHNKKILKDESQESQNSPEDMRTCNCRSNSTCPLEGRCLEKAIIYQATVTAENKASTYIGSTELPFKTRFAGHKSSFVHEHQATSTTLSKHVWNLKKSGKDYELKWEILKRCLPYRCGGKSCDLCLTEKLLILQADEEMTVNRHSEIMQKCRHRNKFKLKSVK